MKSITKLYYKIYHREILSKLNDIKKIEYNKDLGDRLQREKLRNILSYIAEKIPFYEKYKEIINESSIEDPSDLLGKIEVLNKESLNKNFENLKTIEQKLLNKSYNNTSGGSTGTPTKFLYDSYFMSSFSAWKIYCDSFIKEFPPKILRLWGDQNTILGRNNLKKNIRDKLHRTVAINAFNINVKTANDFVKVLDQFRPEILEAYVDALYNLCGILKSNDIKTSFHDYGVISSAGTLYPHMKSYIEEVLGVKVYNRYGSREVGPIAMSCEYGNLHVNNYYLYVEILNENLKRCNPGETGKIHVTTLDNYSMPLIRYSLGDYATLSTLEECPCGRTGTLLKNVDGRESTFIQTKNGEIISGLFFVHFFGVVHSNGSIKNFQIVQNTLKEIEIKVVVSDRTNFLFAKKQIHKSISNLVNNQMDIRWTEVDEIQRLKSGKYLYIINNLNQK